MDDIKHNIMFICDVGVLIDIADSENYIFNITDPNSTDGDLLSRYNTIMTVFTPNRENSKPIAYGIFNHSMIEQTDNSGAIVIEEGMYTSIAYKNGLIVISERPDQLIYSEDHQTIFNSVCSRAIDA